MPVGTAMVETAPISHQAMATAGGIAASLAKLIEGKCAAQRQRLQEQIDSRLQAKINEKKQAMGCAVSECRNLATKPRKNTEYQ